jgi:hypothetical protein
LANNFVIAAHDRDEDGFGFALLGEGGISPFQITGNHSLGRTSSGPIAIAVKKPSSSEMPIDPGGVFSLFRNASSAPRSIGSGHASCCASDINRLPQMLIPTLDKGDSLGIPADGKR